MKKLLYIAIIAALCASACMAEEPRETSQPLSAAPGRVDETPQASGVFSEADAPYDGVWQPFEDGFRLYLPRGWSPIGLSEAQTEAGLFYLAGNGDGTMGVAVGYMRAGALGTVEDLARDFEASGYSGVACLDLNGISAIGFERPEDGYRGVAFFHPVYPDYALYVYASPLDARDADGQQVIEAILASVGPLENSSDGLKKY